MPEWEISMQWDMLNCWYIYKYHFVHWLINNHGDGETLKIVVIVRQWKSLRWWDMKNHWYGETLEIPEMVKHKKLLRWWDIWNYWDGETWKITEMVRHWKSPRWWDITVYGHYGIRRYFSSLTYLNALKSLILAHFNILRSLILLR